MVNVVALTIQIVIMLLISKKLSKCHVETFVQIQLVMHVQTLHVIVLMVQLLHLAPLHPKRVFAIHSALVMKHLEAVVNLRTVFIVAILVLVQHQLQPQHQHPLHLVANLVANAQ